MLTLNIVHVTVHVGVADATPTVCLLVFWSLITITLFTYLFGWQFCCCSFLFFMFFCCCCFCFVVVFCFYLISLHVQVRVWLCFCLCVTPSLYGVRILNLHLWSRVQTSGASSIFFLFLTELELITTYLSL